MRLSFLITPLIALGFCLFPTYSQCEDLAVIFESNVRYEPLDSSPVKTILYEGNLVSVVDRQDNWVQIRWESSRFNKVEMGWIKSESLGYEKPKKYFDETIKLGIGTDKLFEILGKPDKPAWGSRKKVYEYGDTSILVDSKTNTVFGWRRLNTKNVK